MRIRIENAYSDGYESMQVRKVPEFVGTVPELPDYLYQFTGDGHGIGRDVESVHTVTVLESDMPDLVGEVVEFG